MQGANFQLDKEPLLAIPICVPPKSEQERIGKIVAQKIECKQHLARTRNAAEEERITRLMNQLDTKIQESIEAIYGISESERTILRDDAVR